ncbi:hypothetical protein [Vibrio phage phiKT1028]|nr:hypothetical protein [Vibrio phage phiKT1028]
MLSNIFYAILVIVLVLVAIAAFRYVMVRLSIDPREYGYTRSNGLNAKPEFQFYVKYDNGKSHKVKVILASSYKGEYDNYEISEDGELIITMLPCSRNRIGIHFCNTAVRELGEAGKFFHDAFDKDITNLPFILTCGGVRNYLIDAVETEFLRMQYGRLEYLEAKLDRNLTR